MSDLNIWCSEVRSGREFFLYIAAHIHIRRINKCWQKLKSHCKYINVARNGEWQGNSNVVPDLEIMRSNKLRRRGTRGTDTERNINIRWKIIWLLYSKRAASLFLRSAFMQPEIFSIFLEVDQNLFVSEKGYGYSTI